MSGFAGNAVWVCLVSFGAGFAGMGLSGKFSCRFCWPCYLGFGAGIASHAAWVCSEGLW